MLALQRTKCRCPLRIFSDLPLILLLGTSDSLVLLLLSLDEGKNQVFSSNWIDGLFVNAFIVGCFDERLYESLRRELGVLEGSFVVLGLVVANIDGKFELNRDGVLDGLLRVASISDKFENVGTTNKRSHSFNSCEIEIIASTAASRNSSSPVRVNPWTFTSINVLRPLSSSQVAGVVLIGSTYVNISFVLLSYCSKVFSRVNENK